MSKILLIGHFGFTNLGNEAIVRGTVDILREQMPDVWITLISRRAQHDRAICAQKEIRVDEIVPSSGMFPRFGPRWTMQAIARRLFQAGVSHHDYTHAKLYRTHDAVLSIGGDMLSDDRHGIAKGCFGSLARAKLAGAKTVVWGASIGPFKDPAQAQEWARILGRVDLITARESLTIDYLRKIGVERNVQPVADPAFVLEPQRPPGPVRPRPAGKLLVGIGASDLLAQSAQYGERYVEAFSRFIRYLVSEVGAEVRLVAHVRDGQRTTDDVGTCQRVLQLCGCESGVELVDPDYDSAEVKFAIGECDLFIGARTHSTIASFSMLVPTIVVAYSVKGFGITREVMRSDELVIPVEQISFETLRKRFDLLWNARKQIAMDLQLRMPGIRNAARKGGELLASMLKTK